MVAMVRLWWKKIKQHPIVMLLNPCWQQIKHHKVKTLLIPFLIALALTILIGGYKLNWAWTGFTGATESYKTLYDWLQLLFVPVALTGFGFFLNYRERKAAERHADKERQEEERRADNERKIEENRAKTERDIAEDYQREAALQAYISEMSELLLHENLRKSEKDAEVRKIARVRTLTVLPRLDGKRKGSVLKFLYESGLIDKDNIIIYLHGADLHGVELEGANLSNTHLMLVDLHEAYLFSVYLKGADLSLADLHEAYLFGANLNGANLNGVDLHGANLAFTNLKDAFVSTEQLDKALTLQGATMPNGS